MRVVEQVTKLVAYSPASTPLTDPRNGRPPSPLFYWQGQYTLEATTGTDPTFTRATAATFEDFEGLVRTADSSEPRFVGARRVENEFSYPEDLTNGAWTKSAATITAGQTDPEGGTTAFRLTATGPNAWCGDMTTTGIPIGATVQQSWWIKRISGTGSIQLYTGQSGGHRQAISGVTSEWQRFCLATPPVKTASALAAAWLATSGDEIDLWHPLLEDISGQANQAPSEYVSRGSLSAPYHGANIDGVQYFNTLNGNTVSTNVVTEVTGALISASNENADASGPFGYLAEKASTNILLQSNDLSTTWGTFRAANAQNVGTAPDGTNTANSLTSNTTGASGSLSQQAATIGTTTTYSYSVYLKQLVEKDAALFIGDSSVSTLVYFDLEAGTVGSTTGLGFTSITGTIKSVGNGWYRCTLAGTSLTDTSGYFGIYVADADGSVAVTSGASILVWGAQVEASSYPTSYIATAATAVTRNADVLTAGDIITDAAGAAYAEASSIWATVGASAVHVLTRGSAPLLRNVSSSSNIIWTGDGTNTSFSPTGTSYDNAPQSVAAAWGSALTAYLNGSPDLTPAAYDGTMGSGNLEIGMLSSASQWDGTIREVKIFNSELTAAEVGDL